MRLLVCLVTMVTDPKIGESEQKRPGEETMPIKMKEM